MDLTKVCLMICFGTKSVSMSCKRSIISKQLLACVWNDRVASKHGHAVEIIRTQNHIEYSSK